MLTLREMQFEMLPNESATSGVGFGIDLDVSIDDNGFDPGTSEWITQDNSNPTRGYRMFGRDMLSGDTWGFTMHVNRRDTESAVETLGQIRAAWKWGRKLAPGEVLPLRYRLGGRDRRVYGRPRNFAGPPNNLILSGFVPITADFACVDDLTYSDEQKSVKLTAGATGKSTGGFVFPVTFPVTTLPSVDVMQPGEILVDGDEDAYPIIRVEGPITNPWVELDGERIVSLNASLANLQSIVIDTRPWKMSVLQGARSMAGSLSRRQFLEDMTFSPGQHVLRYGGASVSSGATCTVSWRSAWNSI